MQSGGGTSTWCPPASYPPEILALLSNASSCLLFFKKCQHNLDSLSGEVSSLCRLVQCVYPLKIFQGYSIADSDYSMFTSCLQITDTELQDQYREACSRIIKDKLSLTISVVRFVYLGLPRSGKTCLRRRLMGDILNILMAMKKKVEEKKAMEEGVKEEPSTEVVGKAMEEEKKEEPSTGVVEEAMEKKVKEEPSTGVMEEAMEEEVKEKPSTGVMEEAMKEEVKEEPSTGVVEEAGMVIVKNFLHASTGTISMEGGWSAVKDLSEETAMFSQLFLQKSNQKPPSGPPSGKEMKVSTMIPIVLEQNVDIMISSILGALIVNRYRDRDGVIYDLDNIVLLINTDTGGQAEFLEMHAALVTGPSLYLLFWKLIDQFDKEYKMHYTNDKGVSTEEEDSTTTVEEVLFQALASIACFSSTFDSKDEVGVINEVRVIAVKSR